MELDLDTFLVTVYCTVDDVYQEQCAPHKPVCPGRTPALSDSEVLTLALLAQWHPSRSERAFLRYAAAHWRPYFPRLLSVSACNRRIRSLAGVLCVLGPALCTRVQAQCGPGAYEALDSVPVRLMRRCRGHRHRLFGSEAGIGYGGSDGEWYYGVKLCAAVLPSGGISGFVYGPAPTDDRWLAEALLRWRQVPTAPAPSAAALAAVLPPPHRSGGQRVGPPGPLGPRLAVGVSAAVPYVADAGFAGAGWIAHWSTTYQAHVLTTGPAGRAAGPRYPLGWCSLGQLRQVVETVFHHLCATFGLQFPHARTRAGLQARLAAKVAACNMAIYLNTLCGRHAFNIFTPFS